ncbi:MAG: NADH-quinone oxidoreductase subunit C [Clostridia bacterium]|nr:NADH-quinone oxidoreductase subunit C [Bacillota bacterium]MBO2520919.1 NADH-quinone oxidoreductase subunit C [Bacillota bacterium]
MKPEALAEALTSRFAGGIEPLQTPFDIPQFRVAPSVLVDVAAYLRELGYTMLLDVGGVDYFPRSPRFEVVYHFLDMKNRARVRLRCVPEDDQRPEVPSLAGMWPSANPAEREVYDLFGVVFTGHPNLTRILLPSDFEGHPLRKDYPLRGPREKLEARFAAEKNRFHAPKLAGER